MNIKEQIQRDEGYRGSPYKCSEGYWTIGYGRNLETNPMTVDEAGYLLNNDIKEVVHKLKDIGLVSDVNDPRQAVWVNMAFQLGVSGLLRFKNTLRYYQDGDYESCAHEMLDSKWAKQTSNRAKRMSLQMLTGDWQ